MTDDPWETFFRELIAFAVERGKLAALDNAMRSGREDEALAVVLREADWRERDDEDPDAIPF